MTIEFEPFPKIARLHREVTITEKIDGTNAQIIITDDGEVGAASRNRLINPIDDNHGFARWVQNNRQELLNLGPGRHFGEWWGKGVAKRQYNQTGKVFSLFNTSRWNADTAPSCCSIVPVLFKGTFNATCVNESLLLLKAYGSQAAPGFLNPEGIVIWHDHAQQYFKVTLKNDEMSKAEAEARKAGL